MPYFWNKVEGINADLERHRKEERELLEKIAETEADDSPYKEQFLSSYKNLLGLLRQSKAEIANKIGKR